MLPVSLFLTGVAFALVVRPQAHLYINTPGGCVVIKDYGAVSYFLATEVWINRGAPGLPARYNVCHAEPDALSCGMSRHYSYRRRE